MSKEKNNTQAYYTPKAFGAEIPSDWGIVKVLDFSAGKSNPNVVEDKYSYVATPEEIQENDYNPNAPRYVDTFEEEAEVDIAAVQKEIEGLEQELSTVQMQINQYLTQLSK